MTGLFKWQTHIYHLQIWKNRIKSTELVTATVFDDVPVLAIESIEGKRIVSAVGKNAEALTGAESIELVKPFYHGGFFISDVETACAIINHAHYTIQESVPKRWLAPILFLQPMETIDAQSVEVSKLLIKTFHERCGFRKVVVYGADEVVTIDSL